MFEEYDHVENEGRTLKYDLGKMKESFDQTKLFLTMLTTNIPFWKRIAKTLNVP